MVTKKQTKKVLKEYMDALENLMRAGLVDATPEQIKITSQGNTAILYTRNFDNEKAGQNETPDRLDK